MAEKVWVVIHEYTDGNIPNYNVMVFDSKESVDSYHDCVYNRYRSSAQSTIINKRWSVYECEIKTEDKSYLNDPSWCGSLD